MFFDEKTSSRIVHRFQILLRHSNENLSGVAEVNVGVDVDTAVAARHVYRHHRHGASLADARFDGDTDAC